MLESAAATAESLSWFYWLIPVGLVDDGLVAWNWAKVKSAWLSEVDMQIDNLIHNARETVDPAADQIGALKNGFALLLELDRYSPKSMSAEERDASILDGVERLLKARSEART